MSFSTWLTALSTSLRFTEKTALRPIDCPPSIAWRCWSATSHLRLTLRAAMEPGLGPGVARAARDATTRGRGLTGETGCGKWPISVEAAHYPVEASWATLLSSCNSEVEVRDDAEEVRHPGPVACAACARTGAPGRSPALVPDQNGRGPARGPLPDSPDKPVQPNAPIRLVRWISDHERQEGLRRAEESVARRADRGHREGPEDRPAQAKRRVRRAGQ